MRLRKLGNKGVAVPPIGLAGIALLILFLLLNSRQPTEMETTTTTTSTTLGDIRCEDSWASCNGYCTPPGYSCQMVGASCRCLPTTTLFTTTTLPGTTTTSPVTTTTFSYTTTTRYYFTTTIPFTLTCGYVNDARLCFSGSCNSGYSCVVDRLAGFLGHTACKCLASVTTTLAGATTTSTTTTSTTTSTTTTTNPICGHSVGQYCYGYDVAYHTVTYDPYRCGTFPKSSGDTCLYNCAYKEVDNYDQYCWCWDTDTCLYYESCGSGGCYGSVPTTTTTIAYSYLDCKAECANTGRDYKFCQNPSYPTGCRANNGILLPAGDYGCSGFLCCCEWSSVQDACNSYGYSNSYCTNTLHELYNPATSCGGVWLDDASYLCSDPATYRACCVS